MLLRCKMLFNIVKTEFKVNDNIHIENNHKGHSQKENTNKTGLKHDLLIPPD